MNLDVNTLFLVTIYVEAMLGLLLLFAWVQNSAITAVAWWGSAHLLRASSVVLFGMFGSAPDWVSIDLSNAILFTAFAVTWTGARVFDGRSPSIVGLFGGAVLWLVVCRIPAIGHSLEARILISSFIIAGYTWAAAYEFWRGRSEPLVSRWPAIFMLFAHGALFLLRTPLSTLEMKKFDAAVIDPPRSGARQQAEQIARAPIRKLAYVSCDPASFARDIKVLIEHGFTLTKLTPVDQFRWSPHIELVGAFER